MIKRFVKCCDWIILTIFNISFDKNWIVVILKIILSSPEVPHDTGDKTGSECPMYKPFVDEVFVEWDQI